LNELFGLFENFVIVGRPNSLVKFRGQGRGIVRGVRAAEGNPVIMNPRVYENAAVSLLLPKINLTLSLSGDQ
jgi:hypothetical protein